MYGSLSSDKLFFDSIRYRYDMRVFFSIRYDTIRYEGLKEDLLFEEFLANFQNFRRIFGEFSEFSANFQNFRRIFGEFSEFSANFWNFRRKKTKKSLVLRISRYSIWEVRYDILFDIRKSPIYRHSINSRYDKLLAVWLYNLISCIPILSGVNDTMGGGRRYSTLAQTALL